MNTVLWILQIVLAAAFLGAGLMKLLRPKPALVAAGQAYVEDFSDPSIKAIGALEVLAAAGLVLPAVTGVAPILVPLAAAGLFVTMVGAVIVHVRRKEQFVPPLVLGVLALVVAIGRFGPYPL